MSDLSDSSLREEDNDNIIAEYENEDLNRGNISQDEHVSEDEQENDESQEAQETVPRRIDPKTSKKRVTLNPIPKLNTERLKGPKGIQTIEKYFEGFKFHGKGNEKADLDRVMKRLEHWAHRLFPKLHFDDFLERVEVLGFKKDLQTFKKKYRMDEITVDNVSVPQELMDEESDKEESAPVDEFDILIAEQIEKQKQVLHNNTAFDNLLRASDTSAPNKTTISETMPTSSKQNSGELGKSSSGSELTDEIKERIERNRQQAIQRRLARLEAMQEEAKRKKLEESGNINVPNSLTENSSIVNHEIRNEESTAETSTKDITEIKSSLKDTIQISDTSNESMLMKNGE